MSVCCGKRPGDCVGRENPATRRCRTRYPAGTTPCRKRALRVRAQGAVIAAVIALWTGIAGARPESPVVCFFGDSITEGWMDAGLRTTLAYPAIVDSILRGLHVPIEARNLGRAGETTQDALKRVYSDALANSPRLVVIAFGSNDFYIPGNAISPRVSLARFKSNLGLLVTMIRKRGAEPVLLSLPPVIESRYYAFVDRERYLPYGGAAALNRDYSHVIEEIAAITASIYVPVPFDTSAADADCLGFDGQHPTPEGHARIAQVLAVAITERLNAEAPRMDANRSVTVFPRPAFRAREGYLLFGLHAFRGETCLVTICDGSGREIRRLSLQSSAEGRHFLPWDLADEEHRPVAPGMYFARISTAWMERVEKVLVQ